MVDIVCSVHRKWIWRHHSDMIRSTQHTTTTMTLTHILSTRKSNELLYENNQSSLSNGTESTLTIKRTESNNRRSSSSSSSTHPIDRLGGCRSRPTAAVAAVPTTVVVPIGEIKFPTTTTTMMLYQFWYQRWFLWTNIVIGLGSVGYGGVDRGQWW